MAHVRQKPFGNICHCQCTAYAASSVLVRGKLSMKKIPLLLALLVAAAPAVAADWRVAAGNKRVAVIFDAFGRVGTNMGQGCACTKPQTLSHIPS